MQMRELVGELVSRRVREYFSESPIAVTPRPTVYPPASIGQLEALEQRAGQAIELDYREFLTLTDGLEGLPFVLLGCHDWEPGGLGEAAKEFTAMLVECGTPEDVGIPPGAALLPVAVNSDRSAGILLIDTAGFADERFWLTGEGDSFFFRTFSDVLHHLRDSDVSGLRETLDREA
ncbi:MULTISPECIES: SMI1/KNR4 family protein [unclassified Streptomyces]|uniref:SMI1/KNR4 family protein n=1 Tax=unclassified Streptomyces TaxID=2593676 RepID=UPI003803612F